MTQTNPHSESSAIPESVDPAAYSVVHLNLRARDSEYKRMIGELREDRTAEKGKVSEVRKQLKGKKENMR